MTLQTGLEINTNLINTQYFCKVKGAVGVKSGIEYINKKSNFIITTNIISSENK